MKITRNPRTMLMIVFTLALLVVPAAFASAQSLDLDVDVSPLFDAINEFFPVIFQVVAIGAGIAGAVALAGYVGGLIVDALRGRFGG